jgi:hypothetical protein
MKTLTLILVSAFCLIFVGCGRIYGPVDQVKAFADEKEDVILQISKKLEANPTEAGIDEARKILAAKKDRLKAQKEAIEAAPQGFNNDWYSLLLKTEARHDEMLNDIGIKFQAACYSETCRNKWQAMEKDFKETVRRK